MLFWATDKYFLQLACGYSAVRCNASPEIGNARTIIIEIKLM